MERDSLKKGLIITLIISILITIPRFIRFEQSDIWNLTAHFIYIFLLNFIYWYFAQYMVAKNWKLARSFSLYLTITGVFSIGYHIVINHFVFHFKLLNNDFPLMEALNKQNENLILFVRGVLFSGIIYFVVFYLKLLLEKQKNQLEIAQLRKEKLEAQLASLKQQISPHFLFNSLSTLRTMVADESAKKYINKLSNVYRYLLNLNENDLVSLQEELEFTESYLYILKERFEDALQVENNLPMAIVDKKIPPLVLQLLIENAIKHNVTSVKNPLKITIARYNDDNIIISNTIQPKLTTEISTGKGLENIRYRYQILSEQNIVVASIDGVFTVIIPIL
ncbi:MAG: histidine kinase [Flavobacterium sp.]|nr:histidine kinase [Flavobacterium sp.]